MADASAPAAAVTTDAPKTRLPFGVKVARVVLVALALLAACLSLLPGGRAIYRAALLLPAVITNSQPAPLVASGGDVTHTSLTLTSKAGSVFLDVYAPADPVPVVPGARPGVLLIPGVGDNRQDPDLINLDESLARAGYVAMNFTTQSLIDYQLTPLDADSVLVAVQALQKWPGVGHDRVGVFGLSAGGALACLAAAGPRLQGQLAYITLFGGYYNATDVLRDIGRRALDADGTLVPWQPNTVPIVTLANSVAPALSPDDASAILGSLGDETTFQLHPLSDEQVAALSPGGAAVYHLLLGDQPDRVQANLDALPPAAQALLQSLSPSSVVDQIHTPIYLLHDQSDVFVPFTESRDFNAALDRLGTQHEFVELTIFSHVEVKSNEGLGPVLGDGAKLFGMLYQLLLVAA